MADQPEPPRERAKPERPKIPRREQMSLWDSFMLILRPDQGPYADETRRARMREAARNMRHR